MPLRLILITLLALTTGCEAMRTAAFNSAFNRHPSPPDLTRLTPAADSAISAAYHQILSDYAATFENLRGEALTAEQQQQRLREFTSARNAFLAEKMDRDGLSRVEALRAYQNELASLKETLSATSLCTVRLVGAKQGTVVRIDDNYNESTGNSYDYASVEHFFPASDQAAAIELMNAIQEEIRPMGFEAASWTVTDQASNRALKEKQIEGNRTMIASPFLFRLSEADLDQLRANNEALLATMDDPALAVGFAYLWQSEFGQRKDQYYAEFNMKGYIQTDLLQLDLVVIADEENDRFGVQSRVYALIHTN